MSKLNAIRRHLRTNSPAILAGLGVAGLVGTAYYTYRGTVKATETITDEEMARTVRGQEPLSRKEKIQLTWRFFIPAAGVMTVSSVCIVMSHRIGARRTAAVASAYAIATEGFERYRDKVVDKIGPEKEKEIRDELAQEQSNQVIYIPRTGQNYKMFDTYTGRWFENDLETVRRAVNDLCVQITHGEYITLADYQDAVGLEKTDGAEDLGWNTDKVLDIDWSGILNPVTNEPGIAIRFIKPPIPEPYRFL